MSSALLAALYDPTCAGHSTVDIGKTIHPHPTLGESIGMTAEMAHGTCTDVPPPRKKKPGEPAAVLSCSPPERIGRTPRQWRSAIYCQRKRRKSLTGL